MNQKSWATIGVVFLAGIMIISSFSSYIYRGGGPAETAASETWNPTEFGVSGRLINWDFESLGDALGMYPEDLVFTFWINMTSSENLTEAAALALPPTVGLTLRDEVNLYPSPIDRVSWGLFGDEISEFHWTKPAPLGAHGLTVIYNGYQMVPLGTTDLFSVMGTPVLFGSEPSVKTVLDVISGEAPTTEGFVLPYDEIDALQISTLGKDSIDNPGFMPPLGGEYVESYLGISPSEDGYLLTAKYLSLRGQSERRVSNVAESHGLSIRSDGEIVTVSGAVEPENLAETLGAFIAP
ncbi:MAG TPA: hypothetical protein PLM24_07895 [Methanothrix sp.]|nr:hypothetical protein [Methanothrix sp.]HPJ83639.1 hypothetical protein [Methanothrix sp.]HPR67037.1 hypothetical protein [Methanothrix sp.]